MENLHLILAIVALLISGYLLIKSRGTEILAWAVLALALIFIIPGGK